MTEQLTPAEKDAILLRACEDPVFFCRHFFGHLFKTEIPWFHRGILAVLTKKCAFLERYGEVAKIMRNFVYERNGENYPIFFYKDGKICMHLDKFAELIIPRGYSKTTIAGIAVPTYHVLFNEHKFLVYVSESSTHAEMQLDNVKRELEGNEQIKLIFGNLRPDRQDGQKWRADFIETNTGIALAARGRGAQIRGLNHRGQRPTLIIVDDVEDKESVSTEAQRLKTRTWAYGDLMPALPEAEGNGTIVALGTILNREALLLTWAKDPQWTVVRFGAFDKDGELLWPYMMDEKKLAAKKSSYAQAGQLSTFYLEYHNEPRDPETAPFKDGWIVYAVPEVDVPRYFSIYCDPAISSKRTADHAVIAVNAMVPNGQIYTHESWGGLGLAPRMLVDKFFEFGKQYSMIGPCLFGVESNAYQAALIHLIVEEMARHNFYFEVTAVNHKTKKEDRILGILTPRYASGYIKHIRSFPELETQMMDFRRGVEQKDDYLDAQAGSIALLDPYANVASPQYTNKLPPLEEWRAH